jgi:hypothetical protein
VLDRLRSFVRAYFAKVVVVSERQAEGVPADAVRMPRTRSRRYRRVAVAPSERFVWGMVTLIIALVGVIVLEAMHLLITGTVNSEMLAVISGLIGSLVTAFVLGKKQ